MVRYISEGFHTCMVIPSETIRKIHTMGQRRVGIHPNVVPVGGVTRDCAIAEEYSRYREFTVTCMVVQSNPTKVPTRDV